MLKPRELKESFSINLSPNKAMEALTEFIKLKNGAVLCQTENYIKAKFGSRFIARTFGVPLLRALKKTLPFYLDVRVNTQQKLSIVNVCLSDNLGLCIRVPWLKSYQNFFDEIMKEIKNSVLVP